MDFIKTIEDEELPVAQEEEDDEEVDSGFSFSFGKKETPSAWDFKTAKKSLRDFDESKSVDAKISKRLEKNEIKKRKQEEKKSKKQKVDSDDEFVEEGEEGEAEQADNNDTIEPEEEELPQEDVVKEVSKSQKQKKKKSKATKEEAEEDEESKKAKEKFFGKKPEMEITFQWDELQLSRPIMKAIQQLDYKKPSPIQCQCIPLILGGHDICGSAVTGSGKTAAFVIPILQRLLFRDKHNLAIRVVILSPTRELAVQCQSVIEKLAKFTDIRAVLSVGGLNAVQQETALRSLPDIVVATPGRLIDHVRNAKGINLDDVEIFIMDEADRLLEMGFSAEIEEIIKFLPSQRQTLLFSATMTEEVNKLTKLSMKKPIRISVNPSFTTAKTLTQEFIKLKGEREASREAMLLALCKRTVKSKAVIFCKNKFQAHRLKILFGLCKLNAAELHGNLTQNQRLDSLERFREGTADYLLATDLAARGLDILGVETVVNFEMPINLTDYVHRVGRTARAGEKGKAISFAADKDKKLVKQVLEKAQDKVKQRILPPDEVDKCRNEIEKMENDIQIILKQERVETEIRKAELEQRKAENMMQFETEIYSKPKKTWFQTSKEKLAVKEKAKEIELGLPPASSIEIPKLTRQQEKELKMKQKRKEDSRPRNVRREKKFGRDESDDSKFLQTLSKKRLNKRKSEQEAAGPAKRQRKGVPSVTSLEDELRGSSVSGSRGLVKKMQQYDKRKEKSQKKGQKVLAKRMAKNGAGKKRH